MNGSDSIPLLDLGAQYRELRTSIDAAIASVIEKSAFIGGNAVRAFEMEFAAYLGAKHAIGVGSGTDALELALRALGIGAGDRVLTVPFTFAATAEAIVRTGATPLWADIRDDDFNLDLDQATRVLSRTPVKALIVVHLYGQPADMDGILRLARAHDVRVVEDAAQAHGARCPVAGKMCRTGAIGDVGCFSFYPTKNLGAMGDGGAVVSNDDAVAHRVRLLANHGEKKKYQHIIAAGGNSRLDALQAAVLSVKLGRLDAWNAARRSLAARYAAALSGLPVRLPPAPRGTEPVFHQYVIQLDHRDRVRAALAERGIATAVHYHVPLTKQRGFRSYVPADLHFPVAERCAQRVLSLPMFPHLSVESVAAVARALTDILS